ncbi:MAG: hypothetical protein M0Z53_13280 [Thermaerobacter sp.]|nr:hypothetical protein [Thermaerobacter sp.]
MRSTLDRVGLCQLCSDILTSHDVLTTGQAKWCAGCMVVQQATARKNSDMPELPVPARPKMMTKKSAPKPSVAPALLSFESAATAPAEEVSAWWAGLPADFRFELWKTLVVPDWMHDSSLTKLIAAALMDSRGANPSNPGRLWLEVAYSYATAALVAS